MAVEKKAFLLRLPADLHDDLRRWADAELRSLNGQIEFVLRRAVRERLGGGAAERPARPAAHPDDLPDN
jgi:hypothetical protein